MNILPFQSDHFSIRVIDIHGEPWFVGKDIAEALGYSNYRDAIQRHCKGVAKHDTLSTEGGLQKRIGDTWETTPPAKAHYRRFDTMRRHSNGTPVTQLKWATSVLSVIQTA